MMAIRPLQNICAIKLVGTFNKGQENEQQRPPTSQRLHSGRQVQYEQMQSDESFTDAVGELEVAGGFVGRFRQDVYFLKRYSNSYGDDETRYDGLRSGQYEAGTVVPLVRKNEAKPRKKRSILLSPYPKSLADVDNDKELCECLMMGLIGEHGFVGLPFHSLIMCHCSEAGSTSTNTASSTATSTSLTSS